MRRHFFFRLQFYCWKVLSLLQKRKRLENHCITNRSSMDSLEDLSSSCNQALTGRFLTVQYFASIRAASKHQTAAAGLPEFGNNLEELLKHLILRRMGVCGMRTGISWAYSSSAYFGKRAVVVSKAGRKQSLSLGIWSIQHWLVFDRNEKVLLWLWFIKTPSTIFLSPFAHISNGSNHFGCRKGS